MKILAFTFFVSIFALVGCVREDDNLGASTFIDKTDKMELAITEKLPDEGVNKIEMIKSEPKIVLSKWDDEVRMGVRYLGIDATGAKKSNADVMEWKTAKEELHAYAIDENNYEIEVILNEKPSTNVFEFAIDGAENLDFFYQPELTQAQINDGSFRPENVVGSYAVYYKNKANHRTGEKNYGTGKAFHIYRPKAIDNNGAETWAVLDYFGGKLSVTVPQKFLNNAVYPVRVDPTFGYTSCGASQNGIASATSDLSRRRGNGFASTEVGTLDSLHACIDITTNGTADVTLFMNTENTVTDSHTQVASAEVLDGSYTTTAAFYTFTAAGEAVAAVNYNLNAVGNGEDLSAGVGLNMRFDNTGSQTVYSESFTGAGSYTTAKESPWTETDGTSAVRHSIYATYSTAGAAAAGEDFGIIF